MKYIMFETQDGQKLPVIFPEALTHSIVAQAIAIAVEGPMKTTIQPINAGFVNVEEATVHGGSESLNLESNTIDTARIILGESVAFMPDSFVQTMAALIKR